MKLQFFVRNAFSRIMIRGIKSNITLDLSDRKKHLIITLFDVPAKSPGLRFITCNSVIATCALAKTIKTVIMAQNSKARILNSGMEASTNDNTQIRINQIQNENVLNTIETIRWHKRLVCLERIS